MRAVAEESDRNGAMTEHEVVIAGGGPTGLMLAAELALARVDVAIVERRATPGARRLARGRPARTHDRGARSARHRGALPLAGAGRCRSHRSRGSRSTSATSRRATTTGSRCGRTTFERILAAWVDELAVPIYRGREVTGLRPGRRRRRRRAVRRPLVAGGVPRRVRRRAQRDPQDSRHRVPGLGPVRQLPDRRGRDDRASPRSGIRRDDKGVHGHRQARGRQARAGRCAERRARQADRRADARRASPGARRASTAPTTACTTPTWLSRFTDATRQAARVPGGARAPGRRRGARPLPGGRTGAQHRRPGRREPGVEAGPGGQGHLAGEPARHLPSRAAPGRCARAPDHDGADRARPRRRRGRTRCATPWPSC